MLVVIKKCEFFTRKIDFISVCTNLMVQASHIPRHEIRMVSYALWDSGDCRLYKADYVVYTDAPPP